MLTIKFHRLRVWVHVILPILIWNWPVYSRDSRLTFTTVKSFTTIACQPVAPPVLTQLAVGLLNYIFVAFIPRIGEGKGKNRPSECFTFWELGSWEVILVGGSADFGASNRIFSFGGKINSAGGESVWRGIGVFRSFLFFQLFNGILFFLDVLDVPFSRFWASYIINLPSLSRTFI